MSWRNVSSKLTPIKRSALSASILAITLIIAQPLQFESTLTRILIVLVCIVITGLAMYFIKIPNSGEKIEDDSGG